MTNGDKAKCLFLDGLNCSQSVACAFADEIGMDKDDIARLTIGFGGGMGRLREVCGAMSGITFVLSAIYGNNSKADVYKRVQDCAAEFKKRNGSIICKELLGLDKSAPLSPTPEERTTQYYKKRPCAEIVKDAADILREYLDNNSL